MFVDGKVGLGGEAQGEIFGVSDGQIVLSDFWLTQRKKTVGG